MVSKMKSLLLIFVFNLISIIGISQTVNKVELHIAPTLSYRTLDKEHVDLNHTTGVRFDIGMSYMRLIKQKIRIGTGIGYSKMGYNLSDTYPDYYGDPVALDYKFFRNFIEIPLKFSLKVNNESENSFFIDFNIINQLFMSQFTRSLNDDPDEYLSFSDLKDSDMKIYNLAILIGATYEKSFNNNICLNIAPFFKYGILSLDNVHDWNAGLKIGIGYNF
jgi:hypothetical protein